MGPLLKVELKKAFTSKMFFICLAIGLIIAGVSAAQNISNYLSLQEILGNAIANGFEQNPAAAINTPYTEWIGNDPQYP